MSDKTTPCDIHGDGNRRKLYRRMFAAFLLVLALVLLAVLIVWLDLRPAAPMFSLQDAALLQFNLTSGGASALLTTALRITLSSRNPNDRVGVYYDRLDACAIYKGEQVTIPTALPAGYQGHEEVAVWSPYLYGANVPLDGYLSDAFLQDTSSGYLLLYVSVDGRLQWKVGHWLSGNYRLQATCPILLTVDTRRSSGGRAPPYFLFQRMSSCAVDLCLP